MDQKIQVIFKEEENKGTLDGKPVEFLIIPGGIPTQRPILIKASAAASIGEAVKEAIEEAKTKGTGYPFGVLEKIEALPHLKHPTDLNLCRIGGTDYYGFDLILYPEVIIQPKS